MRAWSEARRSGREAGNRFLPNSPQMEDVPVDDQRLVGYLRGRARLYVFDDKKCFFCPKYPKNVGFLRGIGRMKWCKDCKKTYRDCHEVLERVAI